jgi:orotidine 5'-phosphate decarboxylase subfamily 2
MNLYIETLQQALANKKSLVCVGLDPDITKMSETFQKKDNPLLEFNKYIVDQTKDFTAAYKPNIAFYERYGLSGLKALKETIAYIPKDIPVILDAKRGDIGNTAQAYAKAIFEDFGAQATTLAPYMGLDSIAPFLNYTNNYSYVLCLTSNPSAADFEKPDLYKKVAAKISEWNQQHNNCGAVIGATHPAEIQELRAIMPDVSFLIPGIGAQGGDLKNTILKAKNTENQGFLINSSRAIIYAADPAAEAKKLKDSINEVRDAV